MNISVTRFHKQDKDMHFQVLNKVPIFFTICDVIENDEDLTITEVSPTYLCRDLFCKAVIAANIFDIYEETNYASKRLDKDVVYLSIGINTEYVSYLDNLEYLKALHDLEDRLGFRHTNGSFIRDEKFAYLNERYLPSSEQRCILELDGRWLSNSILTSLITGMIRAIVMNGSLLMPSFNSSYFLRTLDTGGSYGPIILYDDDDEDLENSYLKFVKVFDLLIDNFKYLFGDPSSRLFGIDLSEYICGLNPSREFTCTHPITQEYFYPLYSGSNGLVWFLNISYYNNKTITHFNTSQKLHKLYKDSL